MNKLKAYKILQILNKTYPNAGIVLKFSNNFELLISVMLSAQTTDFQVNKTTSVIFPEYKKENSNLKEKYEKYGHLDLKKEQLIEIVNFAFSKNLERDIKSIGLYKNKAKNIKKTSLLLLEKYGGLVPKKMDELTFLPGVGRKTANVVLVYAYGICEGIAVDTHVKRLSLEYDFSKSNNPQRIEKDLMEIFDKKDWPKVTPLLIAHGRALRKEKKDIILEKVLKKD